MPYKRRTGDLSVSVVTGQ